jgi:hypothetical protein
MKKLNNINEEINRMKSLFGDSNLYGNLISENNIKNTLLVEQGIGKRLAKTLAGGSDEIASSLAKALRSVDPTRATKFVNTEIDSFDSFLRHIDDYADIWKTIIPDQTEFDNVVETITAFKNITKDPAKLKKLRGEIAAGNITKKQFLQTFPSNGGVYEMFDDLWESSINGKKVGEDLDDVVIVKTGDDVVVHKVKDGKVVETQKIDNDGKMQDTEVPNAQKNVDDYYAGKTLDDGSGGKKIEEKIEIDGTKGEDNIKGEILTKLEEMFERLKSGGGTKSTIDNLQKRMKEEKKVLMRRNADGTMTEVSEIDVWEVTINEKGEVVGEVKIKSEKIERPVNTDGGGSGSGSKSGSGSGSKSGSGKELSNLEKTKNVLRNTPNFIRWMFPTVSTIGRYTIGWIPYVKNFWRGDRFMFTNIIWDKFPGSTTDGFAYYTKKVSNRVEDGVRIIMVEPLALVGITGLWYEFVEGAEIGDDESRFNAYIANYPNTWVSQIHPFVWVTKGLVAAYGPLTDGRQLGYANCRQEVEKSGVAPNEVDNHPDFTACKTKVDNFFDSIDSYGEKLQNILDRYDYDNWDDEQKMKFCENNPVPPATEGPKTLLFKDIDDLIERMKTIEETSEDVVGGTNKPGVSIANMIITCIEYFTPIDNLDVGGVADAGNIKNNLLEKFKGDKGEMSVPKLETMKSNLEKMCSDYFNKKNREGEQQYKEPEQSDTIPTTSDSTKFDKGLLGLNIEVEQIDIDISDLV